MPGLNPQLLAKVAKFADYKAGNTMSLRQRDLLNKTQQATQGARESGARGLSSKLEDAGLAMRAAAGDPTAIAGLAEKKINQVKEGLSTAANEGMAAFTTRNKNDINVGTAAGHGFRAIGGTLEAAGIKEPEILGVKLSELAATVVESVDKLRNWNNVLHQANAQFAEFSGAMAAVMAHAEVRDILRSQRKGEARAGSAAELERGRGNLEDAMEPLENAFADIQNTLTAALDEALVPAIELITPAVQEIAKELIAFIHWWTGEEAKKKKGKGEDFSLNAALDEWVETQGVPNRFKKR